MNLKPYLLLLPILAILSCESKPPARFIVPDVIPQGSFVDFYAQIHDGTWLKTMHMDRLSNPMPIKVAEKWALSAAEQRLGPRWKDYYIRVTPPSEEPVIIWQRHNTRNH
jgi:hypothetical protein